MDNNKGSRLPHVLLGLYLVVFAVLAFGPYDRGTWFAENLTVWILVGILAALWWRGVRFSNGSYLLMAALIFLHTVGGHYTFERVPFDWITETLGFERNHYDRIAHFSVGFWAYPIAEWLATRRLVANRFLLFTYPVLAIMSIAAFYEIVEWIYAASSDPASGAAYLGSQGDPWDAQKDMLADTLGALCATALFFATGGGPGSTSRMRRQEKNDDEPAVLASDPQLEPPPAEGPAPPRGT